MDRLLADTAEGADTLPLMALTLERLYHDFGDDGQLSLAHYEAMGGMAQIVQTEIDKLLVADPEQRQAQLDILHDAFIPWLATINSDSDQPMRRLARWDDLPAASHQLIQAMVEQRLLVKDTRDGEVVVEVALDFPGAVRADQRDDLAHLHVDVDAAHRPHRAVRDLERPDLEHHSTSATPR